MPRPAKSDDEKRQLIGARFNPDDRRLIEERAKDAGRTPNAEVERLATMFLDCDEPTLSLLRDIADEIAWIESAVTESRSTRWHQHEEVFAAVEEMLKHGPMQSHARRMEDQSPEAFKHFQEEMEVGKKKRAIVLQLAAMGITVKWERFKESTFTLPVTPPQPKKSGIFGNILLDAINNVSSKKDDKPEKESLFSKYLSPGSFDHRITERAAIAAIPDEVIRERALSLFGELVELDHLEETANRAFKEAYAGTLELRSDGQELYRTMRRQRARDAMAQGKPYRGWDLI